MFTDISTGDYPKTLVIRNSPDGMIWQLYHVKNNQEATTLAENAHNNAFYGITLEDHQPSHKKPGLAGEFKLILKLWVKTTSPLSRI